MSGWKPLASKRGIRSHERPPWHKTVNVELCLVRADSKTSLPPLPSSFAQRCPPAAQRLRWSSLAMNVLSDHRDVGHPSC
jgi:hypothetical protein